ncbi:hypothetical protein M422DRAFT_30078 [Sphaerobolus stellatus SS14]|uniref:F-box domain-containing protein n=1 Tax=Sphaerobolus stellatus (strain SS14) TaxID=990650 RepID=A0A0C9VDU3_SPHS4|nr:hypothetical protein M422DRAFT_30078 [Sphaerobolus stellatus SS14]
MTSLLQDVLRPHGIENLNRKLTQTHISKRSPTHGDDSGDELVDVQSLPGSPARSRPSSRPPSPTKGASKRPVPGPLLLSASSSADPLRVFPTELSQRIFGMLSIRDLARCSRVCKKWNKSQSLNYVWFQQYRKENFHDEALPPGKWTRRESKQNWRLEYIRTVRARDADIAHTPYTRPTTPSAGYQTPREVREEQWKLETQGSKPGKVEMREKYKELGGRKARSKTKVGSGGATRDKGGWVDGEEDY